MIKKKKDRTKKPPYCYGYKKVLADYSFIKENEIMLMIDIDPKESLMIVRLDGKGLTKSSKTDDIINEKFYATMAYVIESIKDYAKIRFAYSCNDEISLLLEREHLDDAKIENRLEKILTYLSGYVSSLFTIGWYNQTKELQVTSFDARAIIIKKNEVKNYFLGRQRFSLQHFIEKLSYYYHFEKKGYTIEGIDNLLKTVNKKWNGFPKKVSYGMIGYYNNTEWAVEDANDFEKVGVSFFLKSKNKK